MTKVINVIDGDEIKDAVAEIVPIFDQTAFGHRVLKEDFVFKNPRHFTFERKRYSESLKRKCAARRAHAVAERLAREVESAKCAAMPRCERCGEMFEAKRSDARFCGNTCRVAKSRESKND